MGHTRRRSSNESASAWASLCANWRCVQLYQKTGPDWNGNRIHSGNTGPSVPTAAPLVVRRPFPPRRVAVADQPVLSRALHVNAWLDLTGHRSSIFRGRTAAARQARGWARNRACEYVLFGEEQCRVYMHVHRHTYLGTDTNPKRRCSWGRGGTSTGAGTGNRNRNRHRYSTGTRGQGHDRVRPVSRDYRPSPGPFVLLSRQFRSGIPEKRGIARARRAWSLVGVPG
jgi:hypothetical protein